MASETYTQFGRDYLLTFKNLQNGQVFQINDLRCEFDISLYVDNKDKTSEATISIYNLSRETVNALGDKYGQIRFDVGYAGNLQSVVEGDTINVKTTRSGPDRITTFKLAPNFRNLAIKPIALSFPEGVKLKDVVEVAAAELQLAIEKSSTKAAWQEIELPYGYTAYGTGKQVLDELARAYSIEYRVEFGVLKVNDKWTTSERHETAILLSKETGMIDIPYVDTEQISKRVGSVLADNEQFVSIKQSFKKDGSPRKITKFKARRYSLRVKALINPSIRPNSLIKIQSDEYDAESNMSLGAYYRVRSVQFKGDTRGADWTMDIHGDTVEATEY